MADERLDLAEERTDLAEDRTLLANERTFSGWVRTGLAAIGVGIGFHALFRMVQPEWVAKALATLFVTIGVAMIWSAERRACQLLGRLKAHEVTEPSGRALRMIALAMTAGAAGLLAAIWILA